MSASGERVLDQGGWVALCCCLVLFIPPLFFILGPRLDFSHSRQLSALRMSMARRLPLDWEALRRPPSPKFYELQMDELERAAFLAGAKLSGSEATHELLAKPSPDLLRYLLRVASPDPLAGGWDGLIFIREARALLVRAVILRALEQKVFSSLLFGASEKHKSWLEQLEEDNRNLNRFDKQQSRSLANRVYMNMIPGQTSEVLRDGPPCFWAEVDLVTAQLVALLLPLQKRTLSHNLVISDAAIEKTYQSLHHVVAKAAYLSVAISLNPEIVTFEWAEPGETSNSNLTDCDPRLLLQSKKLSQEFDSRYDGHVSRRARVEIAVQPGIRVHWRATERLGDTRIQTQTVRRPSVIYYWGYSDDRKDAEARIPFAESQDEFPFLKCFDVWVYSCLAFVCLIFAASWFQAIVAAAGGNERSTTRPEVIPEVQPMTLREEGGPGLGFSPCQGVISCWTKQVSEYFRRR